MLRGNHDNFVICEDCKGQAVQREIVAIGTGQVVYQTHHLDLSSPDHTGVYDRIRTFYERLQALQKKCEGAPDEQKKLERGKLVSFSFGGVKPSACATRTDFVPFATGRAFGSDFDIELPSRELEDDIDPAELLAEFAMAALPTIQKMIDGDY